MKAMPRKIDYLREAVDRMRLQGARRILRGLYLLAASPSKWGADLRLYSGAAKAPKGALEYFGYGIYVARKR